MKKTKKPQGYLLALLLLSPILAPLQAEPVSDGSTNLLEAAACRVKKARKKERKPIPEYVFKRFYLDLNVGAAFRVGTPNVKGVSSAAYEIFGMFVTPHNASVGKGIRVGLNFGINFNRYVALEISGNYIAYNPNILSTAYRGYIQDIGSTIQDHQDQTLTGQYTELYQIDAYRGYGNLQVKFSPGFVRVNPYVKFGLSVLGGKYKSRMSVKYALPMDNQGWHSVSSPEFTRQDNFILPGFTSALGIDVRINDWMGFFAEWQFSLYTYDVFSWYDSDVIGVHVPDQFIEFSRESLFGNNSGLNIGLKFKF